MFWFVDSLSRSSELNNALRFIYVQGFQFVCATMCKTSRALHVDTLQAHPSSQVTIESLGFQA